MSAYEIVLMVVFTISLLDIFFQPKKSSFWITFLFLGLVIFVGTRYRVGYDYIPYLEIYNAVRSGVTLNGMEKGYLYFNLLFSDFTYLIFMISLITFWLKFRLIKKYSLMPLISIAYYVGSSLFLEDMGQIRQSMAIAIGATACLFWFEKRWLIGLILFVLSCNIHISCAIFILVPLLIFIPFNLPMLFCLLLFVPLSGLIEFQWIMDKVLFLASFVSDEFAQKYAGYQEISQNTGKGFFNFSIGDYWRFMICGLFLFFWPQLTKLSKHSKFFLSIFVIGTVIKPVLSDTDGAARLIRPLLFFEVLVVPHILYLTKNKFFRLLMYAIIIVFLWARSQSTLQDQAFSTYNSTLLKE